jgi:hypothetical protein
MAWNKELSLSENLLEVSKVWRDKYKKMGATDVVSVLDEMILNMTLDYPETITEEEIIKCQMEKEEEERYKNWLRRFRVGSAGGLENEDNV